jgi:hypothetical protein
MGIKLESDHLILRPIWSAEPVTWFPWSTQLSHCRRLRGTMPVCQDDPGREFTAEQKWEEHHSPGLRDRYRRSKERMGQCDRETGLAALEALWMSTLKLSEAPHLWPRRRLRLQIVRSELIIASYASMKGWGIVVLRRNRMIESEHQGFWTPAEASRHIFLLELEVALRAVKMGRETGKSEASTSIIVGNVALAWALRKGFTRNTVGQSMIESA